MNGLWRASARRPTPEVDLDDPPVRGISKPQLLTQSRHSDQAALNPHGLTSFLPQIAAVVARPTSWEIVAKTWGLHVF
jgi:hypothetical protein